MGIKKIVCQVLLIFIFLLAGIPNTFAIEEVDDDELFNPIEIKDGISLSVLDCVATAFKNSPKIRRKKYDSKMCKCWRC